MTNSSSLAQLVVSNELTEYMDLKTINMTVRETAILGLVTILKIFIGIFTLIMELMLLLSVYLFRTNSSNRKHTYPLIAVRVICQLLIGTHVDRADCW